MAGRSSFRALFLLSTAVGRSQLIMNKTIKNLKALKKYFQVPLQDFTNGYRLPLHQRIFQNYSSVAHP